MTSQSSRSADSFSVVMYSDDILGLGHLRRNTTIASRLVRELPDCSVLLLAGLPSGCFFEFPPGVDFVKLPSVRKIATGCYGPRSLRVSQEGLLQLRAGLIAEVVRAFPPDLLLVDHMPAGIWGELLPTLQELRARPDPPWHVLGLRDVLDAPRVTRGLWEDGRVYQAIDEHYDAVLVYGSREVFDTRVQYHLDRRVSTEIDFCGYVCAERRLAERAALRRDLDLGQEKLVVVTAGGGADGYPMMRQCIEAVRALGPCADFQVLCITGPFMSQAQRDELHARAAGLPVRTLWCVQDAASHIGAADLVVTMAGYNTLMEAVGARKRVLVIPRPGPSAEQRMRTKLFAEHGLVRSADAERDSPQQLGRMLLECLAEDPPQATLPGMDGLDNVVRRLSKLLTARRAAGGTLRAAAGRS